MRFAMHAKLRSALCPALLCLFLLPRIAQGQQSSTANNNELRAVIVLARHGVRAPIASETRSNRYNAQPWPSWPSAPGLLTPHGIQALHLLGEHYRARYSSLLQHVSCEHPDIYVETDIVPRTIASAKAMLSGLSPGCSIEVHHPTHQLNPLFNPATGSDVSKAKLRAAQLGQIGDHLDWFTNAFARPLTELHRILLNCNGGTCKSTKPDFRTAIATNSSAAQQDAMVEGPVKAGADFSENFLLEYVEGMPMSQVGWGRVSRAKLNDLMEMNTRYHDFVLRTPYVAQVFASDLAARISDTLVSAAARTSAKSRLGDAQDRFVLLEGYDSNLSTLGGLLRLHWLLPGQTFDATPPGSALVFELYRNRATGANTVRVFFISQTLNQIRFLSPLSVAHPPSVVPVFVPGCSQAAPGYPCSVQGFAKVVNAAIDPQFVTFADHIVQGQQ